MQLYIRLYKINYGTQKQFFCWLQGNYSSWMHLQEEMEGMQHIQNLWMMKHMKISLENATSWDLLRFFSLEGILREHLLLATFHLKTIFLCWNLSCRWVRNFSTRERKPYINYLSFAAGEDT